MPLRYSPMKLCNATQMANFWFFFASCISASHMQHISHMHSKFALDIQSPTAENRRGKKENRECTHLLCRVAIIVVIVLYSLC